MTTTEADDGDVVIKVGGRKVPFGDDATLSRRRLDAGDGHLGQGAAVCINDENTRVCYANTSVTADDDETGRGTIHEQEGRATMRYRREKQSSRARGARTENRDVCDAH